MKKHNKSIFALFLVISLLAASLCAVPASAADVDELTKETREKLFVETIFKTGETRKASGVAALEQLPGEGLTVLDDEVAQNLLDKINGNGELSYGRIGGDKNVNFETHFVAVLGVGLCSGFNVKNCYIYSLYLSDNDIQAEVNKISKYPESRGEEEELLRFVVVLEKKAFAPLDENSEFFLSVGDEIPNTKYPLSVTSSILDLKPQPDVGVMEYINADTPRTSIEYETLFSSFINYKISAYGLTIFSDAEAVDILERINGDGNLSYGRIGDDHDIDLENYSIVCLCHSVISYGFPVTLVLEDVSVSSDGDIVVDYKREEVWDDGIPSDEFGDHAIIFAVKKSDIEFLTEESDAYIGCYAPSSVFWKKALRLPEKEEIVIPPYDLTGGGVFNSKDLTRLMRYIAGDATATVAQSADINGDGTVDVKDLTRMMKLLAAV